MILMEYRVAIEVVLGVLIAFYALRFSRLYPPLLALALMSTAILTSGWVQGAVYVLFDELLLLALTVGAITSTAVRALGSPLWQPNRLFSAWLRQHFKQEQTTRLTAFTAFLINYGLIGIILLTLVSVANIEKLLRNPALPWITTLPFYIVTLARSLLTDYRDNVLVYLVLVFNAFAMTSPRMPYQTDRVR